MVESKIIKRADSTNICCHCCYNKQRVL